MIVATTVIPSKPNDFVKKIQCWGCSFAISTLFAVYASQGHSN